MNDIHSISGSPERADGILGLPSLDSVGDPADDLLPAGVYLAGIECMNYQTGKSRVDVSLDIAAGPCKGFFGELPPSMDWLHSLYLGLKPNALRFTKRAIKCIGDANPGFDAFAAWNDDLRLFNGRLVFVTVGQREWTNSFGEAETSYRFQAVAPDALRAGSYRIPGVEHADGTSEEPVEGEPVDVDSLLDEALGLSASHGESNE